MNALQQQILEPFVSETLSALTTLAHLPATAGIAFEDKVSEFRFKGYAVATQVSGAIPGKVLLHLYPETAGDVGKRVYTTMMGGMRLDATNEDFTAALSEWANILIGRATRALEASALDIDFGPPLFIADTKDMGDLMTDVVEIVSIPILTDPAGRFYFNYLLHAKTAG